MVEYKVGDEVWWFTITDNRECSCNICVPFETFNTDNMKLVSGKIVEVLNDCVATESGYVGFDSIAGKTRGEALTNLLRVFQVKGE